MIKKEEMAPDAKGCLGKARPDEMLFILRGQDYTSPWVILEWIKMNFETAPDNKLREAFECALTMSKDPNRNMAD